jgi:prepilin-type N-terminal cleavage/methylation domain-containing protein
MGKGLQEGFTLVELFVVLMVASIALGVGIPATTDILDNSRMAAAVNDFVSTTYFARSQALAFGVPITVCASTDGAVCSSSARLLDGYIVFRDTNANGLLDGPANTEPILAIHGPISDNILHNPKTLSGSVQPQYLFFARDGSSPDVGGLGLATRNIQLCDERGARDMGNGIAAGRWLIVQPNGRPVLVDRLTQIQGTDNPLGGC